MGELVVIPSSVWQEWLVENDTLTGQHFTMGEMCTSADREAKVHMQLLHTNRFVHTYVHIPSTCICINRWPLAIFHAFLLRNSYKLIQM